MYSSRIRRTMTDRYPDHAMSKASVVHDWGTAPSGRASSGFQCSAKPDAVVAAMVAVAMADVTSWRWARPAATQRRYDTCGHAEPRQYESGAKVVSSRCTPAGPNGAPYAER